MEPINKYFSDLEHLFSRNYFDFLRFMYSNNYTQMEIYEVLKAYRKALELHSGVKRVSGEAFITHPLSVAFLLAGYGFDYETVCAALLHDTVEDTSYTLEELRHDFGDTIANLVDGVTKMRNSDFDNKEQGRIETHKKIIQSITNDTRIIAIKLADRLHNMYTLNYLSDAKKIKIAAETSEFYVPLARYLGIYQMKDELQDLSLFFLNNDDFLEYYDKRNNIKKNNKEEYLSIGSETRYNLAEKNIQMDYNYKVKNVGGIYDEIKHGYNLENIHDLVAIRMLVKMIPECYKTLDVVSSIRNVVDGSIKDLIKNPKYNGYKSLNANVYAKENQFQVRIRTNEMQVNNGLGVVSNWNPESQKLVNEMCMSLIALDDETIPAKEYVEKTEKVFMKRRQEER